MHQFRVAAANNNSNDDDEDSFDELLEIFEERDVERVFVAGAVVGQLFGKVLVDASLFEHVHEEVVEVPVQNVASNGVPLLRPVLPLEHGDFVDGENVV